MSALCVFFGSTSINFLFEKESAPGTFEYLNFPDVYSPEIFSNYASELDFNNSLFDYVMKVRKEKLSSYEVYVSSLLTPPALSLTPKSYFDIIHCMQPFDTVIPRVIDGCSICYGGNFTSYISTKMVLPSKSLGSYNKETDDHTYFANLTMYPQLVTPEIASQINLDRDIVSKFKNFFLQNDLSDVGLAQSKTVMFSGGRFSQRMCTEELNYILLLDLIGSVGLHTVYLDKKNLFILLGLYKASFGKTLHSLEQYFDPELYVVRVPTELECLITTDTGTSQLLAIQKEKVFVLPMDSNATVTLSVKSATLGSFEKTIKGSRIGIIFDTREKSGPICDNIPLLNDTLDQLSRTLANVTPLNSNYINDFSLKDLGITSKRIRTKTVKGSV